MNKKSQAAMEFLTTYGWVILVVILVIAAFAYAGVPKYDKIAPERCMFLAPIPCIDSSLDSGANKIYLAMRNNNGFAINLTDYVYIESGCAGAVINNINGNTPDVTLTNGEVARVEIDCTDISSGRFKSDISLQYLNLETGLLQTLSGQLTGYVE